jgi:hypothetical protein
MESKEALYRPEYHLLGKSICGCNDLALQRRQAQIDAGCTGLHHHDVLPLVARLSRESVAACTQHLLILDQASDQIKTCNRAYWMNPFLPIVIYVAASIIVIMRVFAVWNRNKVVLATLW